MSQDQQGQKSKADMREVWTAPEVAIFRIKLIIETGPKHALLDAACEHLEKARVLIGEYRQYRSGCDSSRDEPKPTDPSPHEGPSA